MAVKFHDLMKEIKRAEMKYEGETVHYAYRPSAITPQMQLVAVRMQSMSDEKSESKPSDMEALMMDFVSVICNLIFEWDLEDENGRTIPVNRDWVSQMPLAFLSTLFGSAVEDMRPNDKSAGS